MSLAKKFQKLSVAYKVWRLHRKSGLFDFEWYLRKNPDVRAATKRPFLHFAMHGIFEERAPNSQFQSAAYLAANPDIAHTGLTPVQHYVMEGWFQKRLLAPLPRPEEKRLEIEKARLTNEVSDLRREKASANEENDLLLAQLHMVQEELESYFLKNKDLLAERDNLSTRHQSLATDRDAFQKELEASKASGAELEKKRAELAGQLEVRTKERDQARTEKDNLTKERDALKKTVGDRSARIAELEAQIADQAERQKQINEQMVRAETQLEMLKEFLQPAFQ